MCVGVGECGCGNGGGMCVNLVDVVCELFLSRCSIDLPEYLTLSTRPIDTPNQHTLSPHSLPSNHQHPVIGIVSISPHHPLSTLYALTNLVKPTT